MLKYSVPVLIIFLFLSSCNPLDEPQQPAESETACSHVIPPDDCAAAVVLTIDISGSMGDESNTQMVKS